MGKKIKAWKDITLGEFINVQGIFQSMEVYHLPERRMYWRTDDNGVFHAMNFGKIVSRVRFEQILSCLQLSFANDSDQQIIDFLEAVNIQLKKALIPGSTVCFDECMIKSYHRGLKGLIKIIRKPRPIGNELKNMSDAATNIVTLSNYMKVGMSCQQKSMSSHLAKQQQQHFWNLP